MLASVNRTLKHDQLARRPSPVYVCDEPTRDWRQPLTSPVFRLRSAVNLNRSTLVARQASGGSVGKHSCSTCRLAALCGTRRSCGKARVMSAFEPRGPRQLRREVDQPRNDPFPGRARRSRGSQIEGEQPRRTVGGAARDESSQFLHPPDGSSQPVRTRKTICSAAGAITSVAYNHG
jgi:hypothetical protein